MTRIIQSVVFVSIFMIMALVVFPVAAQIQPISGSECGEFGIPCSGNDDTSSMIYYLSTIINIFLGLAGLIAAIFLIMGGIRYITSRGEEEETKKAKNTILFAIIGLIIIGLSAVIVNFVVGAVQSSGGGGEQIYDLPNMNNEELNRSPYV